MRLITFEHHFWVVRKKPLQDWLHVVIGANLVRIWCEFGANFNINNTIKSPSRLSAMHLVQTGLFLLIQLFN